MEGGKVVIIGGGIAINPKAKLDTLDELKKMNRKSGLEKEKQIEGVFDSAMRKYLGIIPWILRNGWQQMKRQSNTIFFRSPPFRKHGLLSMWP